MKFENFQTTVNSVQINAGASDSVNIDIGKSGYKPVAIAGLYTDGTASSFCLPSAVNISSNTNLWLRIRNTGSSQSNMTITANIFYQKI